MAQGDQPAQGLSPLNPLSLPALVTPDWPAYIVATRAVNLPDLCVNLADISSGVRIVTMDHQFMLSISATGLFRDRVWKLIRRHSSSGLKVVNLAFEFKECQGFWLSRRNYVPHKGVIGRALEALTDSSLQKIGYRGAPKASTLQVDFYSIVIKLKYYYTQNF